MWKRFTKLFVLSAVLLLITAACARTPALNSSNASTAEAIAVEEPAAAEEAASVDHVESITPLSGADRVVKVELTEFAIDAASFEFAPGETIEFIVTNSGVVEHEFRLSNQDRVDEHVAGGHADHDEGTMSDEEMAAMDDDEAEHDNSDGHHDDEADHDDDEADHDDDEADHDDDEADHDDDEADHDDDEADHDEAEADHDGQAQDATLVLAAGETGTLIFSFPDNDHDYTAAVCLIPGHYEAGMATDLAYGV
jgi:uncharacterized cupredoxin-like copper-binding protein